MLNSRSIRPSPLPQNDLRKLVDDALAKKAYTYEEAMIETSHAKFDHLDRKIDVNDVLHGLRKPWKSSRAETFCKRFWQWHYAIETEDIEGISLTIIIAVDVPDRSFEVITRW